MKPDVNNPVIFSYQQKQAHHDLVDSHLIMNVLNQMAAQDFKDHGVENSLLFALSDYLREALKHQGCPSLRLNEEVRMLETHLMLAGQVNRTELHLHVDARARSLMGISQGCLARIAACLVKSSKPQYGGKWHMSVELDDDVTSLDRIVIVMELQGFSETHMLDLAGAKQNLIELSNTEVGSAISRSSFFQNQPEHLRLTCCVSTFASGPSMGILR